MNSQAGRIIVGYDGSESAGAALDWAAEQAQRHQLPMTLITVANNGGLLPGEAHDGTRSAAARAAFQTMDQLSFDSYGPFQTTAQTISSLRKNIS